MRDEEYIDVLMEGGNSFSGKRVTDENGNTIFNDKGKATFATNAEGGTVIKAHAQKMDMSKIDRNDLINEFKKAFRALNALVASNSKSHEPLWTEEEFKSVENGKAFNGSSKWLFHVDTADLSISNDEFKAKKPHVGDIDITVPKNRIVDLFHTLDAIETSETVNPIGTKLGESNIYYIGHNKLSPSEDSQINAVFRYPVEGTDYIAFPQVDFEPSTYEDGTPSEWDGFAHSSHWDDIKIGLKGVAHKYGMNILAQLASKDFSLSKAAEKGDIVLSDDNTEDKSKWITTLNVSEAFKLFSEAELEPAKTADDYDESELLKILKTKKSRITKIRSVTGDSPSRAGSYLAFSVGAGVREKYKSVLTSDGKPIKIDGRNLLVIMPTGKAAKDAGIIPEYKTKLLDIFELIFEKPFGLKPFEKTIENEKNTNLQNMDSFVGLVKLVNKIDDPELSRRFVKYMVLRKLWGHLPYFPARVQELEKDKPGETTSTYPDGFIGTKAQYEDRKVKSGIVNYMLGNLKNMTPLDINVDEIATSYYENWANTGGDDIVESFIPFGSKFSKIFEAVEKINSNK